MAALTAQKVIPRVRHRLGVSQEGLSRLLNATKGAVQHWERGRNNPDLGRLLALRRLCPPGPERKELDALIKQTQADYAPVAVDKSVGRIGRHPGGRARDAYSAEVEARLRKDNERLARQLAELQEALNKRDEALRVLEDLATELKKDVAKSRVK
jgi:transcriptional regulator with XRE-family HTH domain